MKPAQKYVHYSAEDIQTIARMTDEGRTAREIAEHLGRSVGSVNNQIGKIRHGKRPVKKEENTPPLREMTPREMIKHLYNLGYRIENNQLVCYTKNVVKIQDIIHGTD